MTDQSKSEEKVTTENQAMTPKEFTKKMRAIANDSSGDTESDHVMADDLMCELLRSLGYQEGVRIFQKMDKWYA